METTIENLEALTTEQLINQGKNIVMDYNKLRNPAGKDGLFCGLNHNRNILNENTPGEDRLLQDSVFLLNEINSRKDRDAILKVLEKFETREYYKHYGK